MPAHTESLIGAKLIKRQSCFPSLDWRFSVTALTEPERRYVCTSSRGETRIAAGREFEERWRLVDKFLRLETTFGSAS